MLPNLTVEVLLEIFSYLDPASLTRVVQASRDFHQIALDQTLWMQKLKLHFPNVYSQCQDEEGLNWYIKFRSAYEKEYANFSSYEKRLLSSTKEGDVTRLQEFGFNWNELQKMSSLLTRAGQFQQVVLDFFYSLATAYFQDHHQDKDNLTLLHWAIACHQSNAIQNLILQNQRQNVNFNINEILRWAAINDYVQDIDLLIVAGADVNATDNNGNTSLHKAAKHGHVNMVNVLLDRGADVNAVNKYASESFHSTFHNTSLHYAAGNGHNDVVNTLIAKGANVNALDDKGLSPLHYAARSGHNDVVNTLIAKGANVNALNWEGSSPLHYAAGKGHNDVVNTLIANGANVNALNQDHSSPLHSAAGRGHNDVVNTLIANGADVNAITRLTSITIVNGIPADSTPLHLATEYDHINVITSLVEKGADVNAADSIGNAPLYRAIGAANINAIKALIAKGADVNAVGREGASPLHWAASAGVCDVVKELLINGANINAVDNYGRTPLVDALRNGHIDVTTMLLDKGANITLPEHESSVTICHLFNNRYASVEQVKDMWKLLTVSLPTQKLQNYIATRGTENVYKRSFTFFGRKINFGYSRDEKLAAAHALLRGVLNGEVKNIPKKYLGALNTGELKTIYRNVRRRR